MSHLNQALSIGAKLYGRRKGRPLRPERNRVMTDLLPRVKIEVSEDQRPVAPQDFFSGEIYEQIWLEIGFGGGEHLMARALRNPQIGIIGCEAFMNGVASLLAYIDAHSIPNVRVYPDDVRHLIHVLKPHLIDRAFILFPDPWPKQRHHKRRLVSDAFIGDIAEIIKIGGELRLASDDQNYVRHMRTVLERNQGFRLNPASLAAPHTPPEDWVETRYEQRGKRKGHTCSYLNYIRC